MKLRITILAACTFTLATALATTPGAFGYDGWSVQVAAAGEPIPGVDVNLYHSTTQSKKKPRAAEKRQDVKGPRRGIAENESPRPSDRKTTAGATTEKRGIVNLPWNKGDRRLIP